MRTHPYRVCFLLSAYSCTSRARKRARYDKRYRRYQCVTTRFIGLKPWKFIFPGGEDFRTALQTANSCRVNQDRGIGFYSISRYVKHYQGAVVHVLNLLCDSDHHNVVPTSLPITADRQLLINFMVDTLGGVVSGDWYELPSDDAVTAARNKAQLSGGIVYDLPKSCLRPII